MRPKIVAARPGTARDAREWRSEGTPRRIQVATAVASPWAMTPKATPPEAMDSTRISQPLRGPFLAKTIVTRANTRGVPMAPTTSMADQVAIPASARRTKGRTYAIASAQPTTSFII
jgi:hypothetical protein